MPKIGRPRAEVVVTDDERAALARLTKRTRVNRAVAFRARIVFRCIDASDTAVARRRRTTKTTVATWRGHFVERRLAGLYNVPRIGAPRTISDEQVEAIIVKTRYRPSVPLDREGPLEKIDYLALLWDRLTTRPATIDVLEWHREVIAEGLRGLDRPITRHSAPSCAATSYTAQMCE
jgi:hypothetical protein